MATNNPNRVDDQNFILDLLSKHAALVAHILEDHASKEIRGSQLYIMKLERFGELAIIPNPDQITAEDEIRQTGETMARMLELKALGRALEVLAMRHSAQGIADYIRSRHQGEKPLGPDTSEDWLDLED